MTDNEFNDFTKTLLFSLLYMAFATPEERQVIFEQLSMEGGEAYDLRTHQEAD